MKRAPFSKDLLPLRSLFTELLPILEAEGDWYGSIYFERKASKSFTANLKQTQMSDQISMGVVLRIYNGYTLFEEATDDLDPSALRLFAQNFSTRVSRSPRASHSTKKPYLPPKWKDRLSAALDPEITCQIPAQVNSKTPVHFGIRFKQDPRTFTSVDCFNQLKGAIDQCKKMAPQYGLLPEDLTYISSRHSFTEEESIFVDRETNLSQTLFRLVFSLTTLSGSDRTYIRVGGLGGLECIEYLDSDLSPLLRDLKALKTAERLEPGKYRLIFGPSLAGVLAHEAFGHSQEGDTCARGRSKAWELYQTGEKVGNHLATILNNPALFQNGDQSYGAWGSYFFDEEGWLSQEQVLLEKGKLLSPMTNLTSSIRLGISRTANGKRENWTNGVYSRQTNTYFQSGDKTLSELMTELNDGFLAIHAAGGMEDPKGMGIQVGIAYLQEIKNGKPTGRVFKGPAGGDIQMTGYVGDVLNSIVAKSKIETESSAPDQAKFPFNDVGGCGKYHKEFVYAGCGGPYMLLDPVILG